MFVNRILSTGRVCQKVVNVPVSSITKPSSATTLYLQSFSTGSSLCKRVEMSNADWAKKLTDEEYYVAREKGTEPPFTGKYYKHSKKGSYTCVCCGAELFSSATKYDSGSGWPSFYDTIKHDGNKSKVAEHDDRSHGMVRTEVTCSQCDAHLGHVFNDGPKPTGLRYCINSVSLNFKPKI